MSGDIKLFKVLMSEEASEMVKEVLDSGFTGQGPKCEEFETKFQLLIDSPTRPLLVNSCTSALDLSFQMVGLKPGDVVLCPPQSCFASFNNIPFYGAKIRWVDINPLTGLIDPKDVEKKICSNTKAIIAVDWGGAACDYDRLKKFGLPVIEDAAHGPLISYKGQSVARTGGDYVCYSHQSIKTLSMADGGSLILPPDKYKDAKLARWYGLDRESSSDFRCSQNIKILGKKHQSNDVAAAIGLANIKLTSWAVDRQRDNAKFYSEVLSSLSKIYAPEASNESNWWLYTIVLIEKENRRQDLMFHLSQKGIACSQVHRRCDEHDCFKEFKSDSLPGVDYFSSRELAIPVGWWVTDKDRKYIAETIIEWAT